MSTIADVAQALQSVFTTQADALARRTGFVQRQSKLTGAAFAQALVFGWLGDPQASLDALAQAAAAVGVPISPQGLDQRCGESGALFLEELVAVALRTVIATDPVALPLLERFTGVVLVDSSTITLPAALAAVWPGCSTGTAALKVHVRYDLCAGTLSGPHVTDGRTSERSTPAQTAALPVGTLRLADLGYFDLGVHADMSAQGVFWLSRLNTQTALYDPDGRRWEGLADLEGQGTDMIDVPVLLGSTRQVPGRLLAHRVPPAVAAERRRRLRARAKDKGALPSAHGLAWADWTVLVTNVPAPLLSLPEALVLLRARWQIEMLFKLWKSHGHVDDSRSHKPWRILCEVFAKLLAMIVQHWVLLTGCWIRPDRSLTKAAHAVRQHALSLASTLTSSAHLCAILARIGRCLAAGSRLNRRKKKPNTYQLLLDPSLSGLA